MRCKACNRLMGDMEVISNKEDGTEEDMCGICRSASHSEYNYTSDHEYVGDYLIDGLTPSKNHSE